jgi:hypothetical protein
VQLCVEKGHVGVLKKRPFHTAIDDAYFNDTLLNSRPAKPPYPKRNKKPSRREVPPSVTSALGKPQINQPARIIKDRL